MSRAGGIPGVHAGEDVKPGVRQTPRRLAAAGPIFFGRGAMDEQEQQRRRITEYGAALLVWLDNLPTVGRPDRGDRETRERAEAELERLRLEDGEGVDRAG